MMRSSGCGWMKQASSDDQDVERRDLRGACDRESRAMECGVNAGVERQDSSSLMGSAVVALKRDGDAQRTTMRYDSILGRIW